MKGTKESNTKNKIQKSKRGITLIALVITIIVMLILVSVTISMAINGGLFGYAQKAVGDTQNAIDLEQQLADGKIKIGDKWYASIDDYIAGKPMGEEGETPGGEEPPVLEEPVELPEGIKVGDYVDYTPTAGTYKVADSATGYTTTDGYQSFSTEDLEWRILSIDEETGEIELVAATQTGSKLQLKGADGYNHAVDILNDMCKALYSNEDGATARSINVEDINEKTTYDPTTDTSYASTYGKEYKYSAYDTGYRKYPNLYAKEEGYYEGGVKKTGGIEGSVGLNDGVTDETTKITTYSTVTGYTDDNDEAKTKDISVTYTYYYYAAENYLKTDLGINNAPAGLLKTGTTYWLASRCVYANSNGAYFVGRIMNSGGSVGDYSLFNSDGDAGSPSCTVRPVVSLGSNVTITKDTESSTESKTVWDVEF